MKLLVILSVIAIGYADKLDRTYLPPSSAASAGGSPGALTAPAFQSGPSFGQSLPSGSGSTPRPAGFTSGPIGFTPRPSGFGPGLAGDAQRPIEFGQISAPAQGSADLGQGPSTFGQKLSAFGPGPSGSSQQPSSFGQGPSGFSQGPSSFSQGPSSFNQGPSNFGQGPTGINQGSSGFSRGPSGASQGPSSFGQGPSKSEQSSVLDSANKGVQNGNGFVSSQASATPGNSYDAAFETRIPSAPLGFGSPQGVNQAGQFGNGPFNQGFGQGPFGPVGPQAYTPERPQAAADRSATILTYNSENNGDSYKYNYETSNGISAGEEGVATNGVRAQGGYSYIGDDGVSYSVTYTADENGYQPQGDHIPTPHPIPEEILKSIEENARAAAAGTQEGAYRPEEYESESPQQQYNAGPAGFNQPQYNAGPAGFNQPQGPNVDAIQGPQSAQGQFNRPDSNQFPGSLNQFPQRRPIGVSGQYGQGNTGSFGQFDGKANAGLSQNSQGQGQGANGYNYNQPQGPSSQFRPQVNAQEQTDLSANIGSNKIQSSTGPSANGISGISSLGGSQNQFQTGLGQSNTLPGNKANSGRTSSQGQKSSFGSPQGYQYTPGSTPFGPTGSSGQGSQYQQNTNQNALGVNGPSSESQNTGVVIGQGNQNQYGNKQSVDSIVDVAKISPFAYNQNSQSSSSFGRGPQQNGNQAALGSNLGSNQGSSQYAFNNQAFGSTTPTPVRGSQFNGNQPTFGSNIGSNQGAQQFGTGNQASGPGVSATAGVRDSQSIQAPYQYNRPSQGFDSQPQRPGFNGAQGPTPSSQGGQRGSEQFVGPRQPPSFTPEEGYKY